jgi:uncharacterized protein YwgA
MDLQKLSWKTASAGIVTALVAVIGFVSTWVETGQQPNIAATTAMVSAVVTAIGLLVARDNDKTSREVGATVWESERNKEELKNL